MPEPTDQIITDYDGKEIKVGTRVTYYDTPPVNDSYIAEVIEITDWDGDVDDDTLRHISIPPDVKVKFPDGTIETFATSEWEFDWVKLDEEYPEQMPARGKVEDLLVVENK